MLAIKTTSLYSKTSRTVFVEDFRHYDVLVIFSIIINYYKCIYLSGFMAYKRLTALETSSVSNHIEICLSPQ